MLFEILKLYVENDFKKLNKKPLVPAFIRMKGLNLKFKIPLIS